MGSSDGRTARTGRALAVSVALILMMALPVPAMPTLVAATDADETWRSVELPPPVRPVELEASEVDATGIPVDASFRLVSVDAAPASQFADALVVEPHIAMSVESGANASEVELRPERALEPGSQLHFTLLSDDGARLGAWSFHVRTPVDVVETLPRHERENVPVDTSIELTFDRDGVLEPERSFSIDPPVKGRFERRGRVLSFVPSKPLRVDTVYRVTLAAGVGTDDPRTRTTEDVSIDFATRRAKGARVRPAAVFNQRVAEARPGEPAVVEVYGGQRKTEQIPVDIYRFGSMEAVESALLGVRSVNVFPYREHVIDTKGMEQLRSQQARLQPLDRWDWERRALTLAKPLSAGWYLLVIPVREGKGPGSQLILQVTDLSTYAHVTTTSSVFWVNDVRTGEPVDGAEVAIVGGPTIGRTDADGLLETATPEALAAHEPTPLVSVRTADAAVYLPFAGGSWSGPNRESWGREVEPGDLNWSFLYTDRGAYRSTDTINVWGMYRDRADGSVPDEVELRLRLDWNQFDSDEAPPPSIVTTSARPSADGVFSGSLPFEDLPLGGYLLEVAEGDETIGQTWVEVVHIIKPAYRLDVATNRRAYLAGDNVRVSVTASFFDGTTVPGAPLIVSSGGQSRATITNATGRAVARTKARAGGGGQISQQVVRARPRRSEEGEISAGSGIVVLPSTHFLDAQVTRGGGEIRVSGNVHAVDFERLERQIEQDVDGPLDPRGAPVPGATVTARVTETEWIRRQEGTEYDFITKKVIPVYTYREKRRRSEPRELTAGPDGAFDFTAPAVAGRGYEVTLSNVDPGGRTARITRTAWRPWPVERGTEPYLAIAGSDDDEDSAIVADGERYAVELRQGSEPQPTGGPNRYLFLLQQVGLHETFVGRSPVQTFTFQPSHAPMVSIGAVRFTGATYVPVADGFTAYLRPETRQLGIDLTTDRPRYGPGDTVELAVRTSRRDGEGVPASVVLRAVDEKLYAMGLAGQIDPLEELYRPVWSGTIRTYASHLLPSGSRSGKDTGGGGDAGGSGRSDFRDSVLFEQVETDVDGDARVRFEVSDDLTSWRVSATAVSDGIEAGESSTLVPVGLPFFVELVSAPEFVVGDAARLRLRAYGPGLRADEPVTFTVSAPTLGMAPTRVEGTAFKTTNMPMPPLVEGRHAITVDGVAHAGTADELHDRLTRSITVRRSRLEQGRTDYATLAQSRTVPGGDGLTTVVISDAGRGRFFPDLVSLSWSDGPRADEALAAAEARRLLERTFGEESLDAPEAAFDAGQFQSPDGLIALLPYSSSSESLSALVAIATPDAVDRAALLDGFRDLQWRGNVSRERKLQAFVARAALGDDVLDRLLRYLDDERLTTFERLLVGIGIAAAGDEARALEIERDLLALYGQQLGQWVRLWDDEAAAAEAEPPRSGDKKSSSIVSRALERSAEHTALLSILAAAVGDDAVAAAADAYVAENPPDETLATLQRIAYISRLIERTPSQPASFTWQIDGDAQRVDLGAGESHHMVLTGPQREALRLEPVSGSLGVASSWREPLDAAALTQDGRISVERTAKPEGVIRSSDTVEVTLAVDLGPAAVSDCYLVTEFAPSGIAPVREGASWRRRGRTDDADGDAISPWSVQGQRVTWCVEADPDEPLQTLRYQGRVVNPGSYRWEPALVQSTRAPELARLGQAETLALGSRTLRESTDPAIDGE